MFYSSDPEKDRLHLIKCSGSTAAAIFCRLTAGEAEAGLAAAMFLLRGGRWKRGGVLVWVG